MYNWRHEKNSTKKVLKNGLFITRQLLPFIKVFTYWELEYLTYWVLGADCFHKSGTFFSKNQGKGFPENVFFTRPFSNNLYIMRITGGLLAAEYTFLEKFAFQKFPEIVLKRHVVLSNKLAGKPPVKNIIITGTSCGDNQDSSTYVIWRLLDMPITIITHHHVPPNLWTTAWSRWKRIQWINHWITPVPLIVRLNYEILTWHQSVQEQCPNCHLIVPGNDMQ